MKRIEGYVYKFGNDFGSTTRTISKEEFSIQLDYMEEHNVCIPVTTCPDALIEDLYKHPMKIDGYARLTLRDDGIYATIKTNGNIIDHFTNEFILENFNLGMALVCDNPSFYNSVLKAVWITHLTVGRFLTKTIYKPERVITIEKSEKI